MDGPALYSKQILPLKNFSYLALGFPVDLLSCS